MSTTIDNRVVEMQFDNRHFEQNVSTTMSTLDKLKQKLHLDGATKGLENVNSAAKNVNVSGIGSAVEAVSAKFSALDVIGVTALANITNSAVNAGKRILSALTVDPVKTGFSEYELKLDSVKTIIASTGESVERVNELLGELNEYSDQTIYSFKDMTQNIGKFTNAGVKLEDAVLAIKGISNEAAVSGANANEASRAMYNFAQALSAGYVKLIDWKSIENANMATVEFKEELIKTAVELGTLKEAGDGMYDVVNVVSKANAVSLNATRDFNDSLGNQWMTTDVLVKTLGRYADATTDIGKKAFAAAQDVTKFTQMWDILKETAQSGWARTWEILIGDIEQAKALLSPLTDFLGSIIEGIDDVRNSILESALTRGFSKLKESLGDLLKPAQTAIDSVKDMTSGIAGITKSLAEHEAVVSSVIKGDWGNYTARWNKLTEAGYDWVHVQNLVNERLNNSKRRTSEYTEWLKNQGKETEKVTESETKLISELAKLSEAELKALGYSDEQIASLKEIIKWADKLGMSVDEFLEKIDQINGRWLIIESFKNIGKTLVDAFGAVKQAWQEIFPPKSVEERAEGVFNLIAAFHKFTRSLTKFRDAEGNLTEDGENLVRTFKGIFAIVDLLTTIFGGAFKIAFKVAGEVLKYFNLDILDVTAYIGDAIVGFRDTIKGMFDITKVLDKVVPALKKFIPIAKEHLVKGFKSIPTDMIAGFANGIWEGMKNAADPVIELAKKILAKFREVLGIHSPSRETKEDGKNFVLGFTSGISEFASKAFAKIRDFGKKCVDVFSGIDFGNLIALGISGAAIVGVFKIGQALNALIAPLEAFDDIGDGFKRISKGIKGALSGVKWAMYGEAVKSLAIAIGILAAALVVLSFIKPENLWNAVGALAALAAIIGVLVFTMSKFVVGDIGGIGKVVLAILGISAAMMLLAGALKIINGLDVTTVLGVMSGIIMLFVSIGLIANTPGAKKIGSFGFILAKLGTALLLLTIVLKIIGTMDPAESKQGMMGIVAILGVLLLFITLLQFVAKGNALKGVDKTLYSVAGAMLVMTIIAKIIGNMDLNKAIQGGVGILALAAIIVGIVYFLKPLSKDQNLKGIGTALFGIAAAMMVMALVMKIVGGMNPAKALQGMAGVAVLAGLIVGMVYALKPLEKDQNLKRVGRTLLMMSVAIGILALVATLLGFISLDNLAKGVVAVGVISLMMMGLAVSARGIGPDTNKTIIAIAVSMAILVAAVAALGLIDPTKLAAGTLAVSAILGMFALVLKMAGTVQKATGTMWAIVAMITVLSVALYLLARMPVENTLGAATALSLMLIALSGSLMILSKIGATFSMALQGIMLLTAMAVPMLAFVGVLALMSGVKNAEANAALLTGLMLTMSLMLIPLTAIGLVGGAAAAGLAVLTGVIVAIGVLVGAIGALMTEFPQLEKFVDKGLGLLEKLGLGIGKALGAIVTGFVSTAAMSLPILGAALSAFWNLGKGFFEGVATIDGKVLTGTAILAAAIALLGVADLIAMITTLGGIGLPALGGMLSGFWNYGKDFFEGIKGVDGSSLEGVKALAQAIMILTGADILDTLTSWFTGGNSLTQFGEELSKFGPYMKQYSDAVTGIDVTAVETSATAAKKLAEMAKSLPNSGGLLGKIMGNNDMDTFGKQLKGFGESLIEYGKAVSGIGAYTESIEASATAASGLVDLAKSIPNSGGWLGGIVGNNDMDTFGEDLKGFGEGLMNYGKAVTGIDSHAASIEASIPAAEGLVKLADTIPNSGGWLGSIVGNNDIDTFGSKLKTFGEGIKGYAIAVKNINADSINASVGAAEGLAKVAKSVEKVTTTKMVTFGQNAASFGGHMATYAEKVAGIDASMLSAVRVEFARLAELASKISNSDTSGFGSFGSDIGKIATAGVNNFIAAFAGSYDKVKNVINNFIIAATTTLTLGKVRMTVAVDALIDACMTAFDETTDAFYTAGSNLVKGFANGISANSYIASLASKRMAAQAAEAAKKELDEHSPSRVGYEIGDFFGIAVVNGISDNVKRVYNTSTELAKNARTGLSDAIGKVSDLINSDIDAQPTIRPVLDLSDIRSGAGMINGLFADSSVGVMANVSSISSGMRGYNQNGSNDDVISAINDLKNAFSGTGDTYQINGVTYDDGSNIADAVKSLVRAAKVERRV